MKPGNPKYRYLYTIWACLETLGFGGLLYGWSSLVFVLKDEGLYLDLCDDDHGGSNSTTPAMLTSKNETDGNCQARDARLALVFTVGSAVFAGCTFLLGQVNFSFGTRITRLVASLIFITGSICCAFTSNDIPWLIFPGLSLIGGGGIGFLMTNTQISLLFPMGGSFVVGIICGSFDASSGTMLMMKLGYEGGISRFTSFVIIACSHLLTLISTFFFLPKDFIKKPVDKEIVVKKPPEIKDVTSNIFKDSKKYVAEPEKGKTEPEKKMTLKSCMLSPVYLLHVAWVSVLQLRFYFLLASLNKIMNNRLDTKDEVSEYTNVMMYILMCGFFVSPFAGFVFDVHVRLFKGSRSALRRSVMPAVIPLVITTILCIAWSAIMSLEDPQILYGVFVLLVCFRSFLYMLAAGYLSRIFPSEYFGIMYGVQMVIAGIVSFLQYALFVWGEAESFELVNNIMIIPVFLTFAHPIYQWVSCTRAENACAIKI